MAAAPIQLAKWAEDFKANRLAGILLSSVESWLDEKGIHPLQDNGVPDLTKDMVTKYSEIEYIEFVSMMSSTDERAYRTALKQYAPNLRITKALKL
jgi:hypothetical protein